MDWPLVGALPDLNSAVVVCCDRGGCGVLTLVVCVLCVCVCVCVRACAGARARVSDTTLGCDRDYAAAYPRHLRHHPRLLGPHLGFWN